MTTKLSKRRLFTAVRLPLFVAALLTAGCTRDLDPVSLAELGPHTVFVEGSSATHWNIRISHADPEDNCAPLADGVTATLDGHPIPLVDPGGEHITRLQRVCSGPLFGVELEPPTGPDAPMTTRIEISDSSARIVLEAQRMREPRTFVPSAPVPPGGKAELAWSHPFDEEVDVVDPDFLTFDYDAPSMSEALGLKGEMQGQTLVIPFPDTAPPGKGTIEIDSHASAPILTCDGAVECQTSLWLTGHVPLEISAPGP
ncbi:hypothetical protein [Polyangium aurulentum]|uniref:hypothetical protein n=1 Tax=Polyangium aurulentum TaxID=2567896 RepID=UPI0010ADDE52|nr:hypothetical protein [Polyangium aurulentum]UQA62747.1 hypothetical protein E8A73_020780 [Polyangium aurulentum]